MLVCSGCGGENPERFRVCGFCGAELAPNVPFREIRKTVSIVFCDLQGSTSLGERLDSESLREVLTIYFDAMRQVLERHGGAVEKYIGDAIMAVFGVPQLHEDDALRAVRASLEMQTELSAVNERLEAEYGVRLANRTGVNTGEVVSGDVWGGQRLVTGDVVNVAARLEQAAPAMEILIGEPTFRLVKDVVDAEPVNTLELKGKSEPMPAYRLLSVLADTGVVRRLDAPMVGRSHELAVLNDALARALEFRTCQVVAVVGPAGVGKSRLLREFVNRSENRAQTLRGRCLPYGHGITFWPLAEVAQEAAGIESEDSREGALAKLAALLGEHESEVAERIAGAIGLSLATFPVEETFWAARRLFEILSRRTPLVVHIDDIHWAEHAFLDLIRAVADTATDAPIVLACSAREDLLEEHADWQDDASPVQIVVVEPLPDDECIQIVADRLGATDLDVEITTKIVEAAEGNPLFAEQMLSMLIDDGSLDQDEHGRWVLVDDAGAPTIPPTISALLSARLDRLGPVDRLVIERGSVMGQVFYRGAVEDLSPDEVRLHIDGSLGNLARKGLIHSHESTFAGQEAYRFTHILVQDAAYRGLLKRARAELHVRFVDWLERVAQDRITELEEIRGYHLEQAFLTLMELSSLDEEVQQVGVRGAGYLSAAGHRAVARGDVRAAASLLSRAGSLLPIGHPDRPRLFLGAAEALIETGTFAESDDLIHRAIQEANDVGDRGLELTARVVRLELGYTTAPEEFEGTVVDEVERIVPELNALQHHEGLARAWRLLMLVHEMALRWGDAEAAAQRTLEQAKLAGDHLMQERAIPSLAYCKLSGPTPVPEAIERCEALLEDVRGDGKGEALLLSALSHLEAMRGNFDFARGLYRRSRQILEELGWTFLAAQTSFDSGPVEMLAGDPEAAETELRRDYATLERMGEKNYISTTAALLSRAVHEQGLDDEALKFSEISEALAAPDDLTSQALWRGVRARVLVKRGETEKAEELAREAVLLIGAADSPEAQGDALTALAEVLASTGRHDEAVSVLHEAAGLFERKGVRISAERAWNRAAELGEPALG